jgi:hypothetical protein
MFHAIYSMRKTATQEGFNARVRNVAGHVRPLPVLETDSQGGKEMPAKFTVSEGKN